MIKTIHDLNGQYLKPEVIQETVLQYFGYEMSEIIIRDRHHPLPYVRQVLLTFLRKKTRMTYQAIAEHINLKDHRYVMYSIDHINDLMYSDAIVLKQIEEINNLLKSTHAKI